MPRLLKPSLKMKRFAKAYVKNGGNATKATLEAYDTSYDGAQVLGSQNMQKPMVIEEINRILALTNEDSDKFVADKLLESITSGIGVKATNKDALQGINMLLKLRNAYPSSKSSSVKVSLRGTMSQDTVDSVVSTLTNLSTKSKELIDDIK